MNRHFNRMTCVLTVALSATLSTSLLGCSLEDQDEARERPESIEGYQIVQTITDVDSYPQNIETGETITYQLANQSSVFREGFQVIALNLFEPWNYENTGEDTARLVFNYWGDVGSSEHELRFTGSHHGTFETTIELDDATGGYRGTFVLQRIDTVHWDREGYQLCREDCEVRHRCGGFTADENSRCKTSCWNNVTYHGAPRECLEVREPTHSCLYQQSCSDIETWRSYQNDPDIDEASVPCRSEAELFRVCTSFFNDRFNPPWE